MHIAGYPSLIFTVALMVTNGYFLLGRISLLTLSHDTPQDERFVRRFFEIYYKAALFAALGAAISYALWGRFRFAAGAVGIALLVMQLRRRILPAMDQVGAKIQKADPVAIKSFRKVQGMALFANLVQLVLLVWAITNISIT